MTQITLLGPNQIEACYRRLGGSSNPTLFPPHFLQAALPRIGGQVVVAHSQGAEVAVGVLFPRRQATPGPFRPAYTLRYHPLTTVAGIDLAALQQQLIPHLGTNEIIPYDPHGALHYQTSHLLVGQVDLGRPDEHEAAAIRRLQQQVWGSPPGSLYPADIHSSEFGLGTSLVARIGGQPVGFLFGFIKFGGYPLPADWQERFGGDLRLESQTLGVLPAHRGAKIGFLLKKRQAELAQAAGIGIINWTVDPLQWPNAVLNFGRLRAIAFDFTPDYYPFRNELNRVAASRFSLTWLVQSARVQMALSPTTTTAEPASTLLDLRQEPGIVRVNEGWQVQVTHPTAPRIAFEIPADWTALQQQDLDAALAWRTTTDALFQRLIGPAPGQYVITTVGLQDERRYLIGEQVSDELWLRLGQA